MFPPRMATGVWLAAVCLGLLGIMPIVANSRPSGFDALGFAFLLSVWQVVFSLPLCLWELRSGGRGIFSRHIEVAQKRRAWLVAVSTGAMFGLATYLYVLGIEKAGAVSAAIAIQAYPLFAILWEALFLKRRKTMVELMFTASLIAALCYLGTGGTWMIADLSPWFLLALGVPFLWSIAHVVIREELVRTPITPAQVTFFRVSVSAVLLGGVLALIDPATLWRTLLRPDYQVFGMAMGLIYYLELVIWFYAVRHIDVSLASSITTPWPAVTMVLAIVFLGDRVESYQIITFAAVVICLYGLLVAGLRNQRTQASVQR